MLNLNLEEEECLYQLGAVKFHSGDYEGAKSVFLLLNMTNATNLKYIKSLASCYQQQGNYAQAAAMYHIAYLLARSHELDCLFFSAYCRLENKESALARNQFKQYIEEVAKDSQYLARAKLYLKGLE